MLKKHEIGIFLKSKTSKKGNAQINQYHCKKETSKWHPLPIWSAIAHLFVLNKCILWFLIQKMSSYFFHVIKIFT
jgi:hypothetical protein